MKTKDHIRAQWMGKFCDTVELLAPGLSGRIDWNTAIHFFFTGRDPVEAAKHYVETRK